MHYLTISMLLLGLLISPTMAQDPPTDPVTTEKATPAAETVDVAPAADKSVPEGEKVATEDVDATPAKDTEASKHEETPKALETDEEALQTTLSLIDALKAGQWPLAAGLFLTLLVYLVNRFAFKDAVSEKMVPWLAGGVGVAGAIGTGLLTGMPVFEALTAGVVAGVMAVGGWEAVLKHMVPAKAESA